MNMKKKTFDIGTGVFGQGRPKICVPIVAEDQAKIWKKAEEIRTLPADMVEWRADFYKDVFCPEQVRATLLGLKERLLEKGILFTFRTSGEGGNLPVEKDVYYELNRVAAASGFADLVDVEAFFCEKETREVIGAIHGYGCRVIASNHDFAHTPDTDEMVRRLKRMEELGADAAKLAVMPENREDVLRLLAATVRADEALEIPVVTMSMGRLGMPSRLAGSLTGSAMTFGAAGEVSAPGQLPVRELAEIMNYM